ncbi:CotS family spore coat protein [Hathewaya limosa]|uniref:CotS family spore coat protein n=1 Tax=Hathewaya limosa TaxID=1536 RepID=A0ABU0JR31_HATLI|nr:CotS family spore coat protein [Hathewaya limosa]MDQ0478362.1 CotS family spore coat protein [Hathewaya limosa]
MFDEVKKIVEENYELKVEHIEKIKNVYKIKSLNNYYSLKVIKYEFAHFYFIISAMKHLQNNGYKGVPKFILTKDNKEYINFYDKYAYLNPWLECRQSNYDNLIDVYLAAKNLAEFHKKSVNFQVEDSMKPRVGWFKWIETFNTRKNEILDFKNTISKKNKKTDFDFQYEKIMDDELKRCDRSIKHIKESKYSELMHKEILNKGFCHHDYANHNVLIDKDNKIYVIDFDYCILDTHLHDLSSLIIRKMKNGKWNLNNAKDILRVYDHIYAILPEELEVMAAFIEFPQAYWQLGIQYYWEHQPWEEEFFLKKLNRIRLDREERQEFVDQFKYMSI